jgi:WhiB family redox-sensing transcriptional regulator
LLENPWDNFLQDWDTSWHNDAECSGIDTRYKGEEYTDIFYPPRDKDLYKDIANEGKSYCFGNGETLPCPVRLNCLWEAIRTDEQHGIWGGLSHRERNALVRKWQRKYRHKMTLKEYIFQLNEKGKK